MQHLTMEQWAEKIAANTLAGPETEHLLARRALVAKQWHDKIQQAVHDGTIPYKNDLHEVYAPDSMVNFFRPDGFIAINDIAGWLGELRYLVVTGSSYPGVAPKPAEYLPEPDTTKPDWSLWTHIPQPPLWQAVALSLDLSPDAHRVGWNNSPDSCSTLPPDFNKRMRIAMANLAALNLVRDVSKPSHMLQVPMATFSAWARSIGWPLPENFPGAGVASAQMAAQVSIEPVGRAHGAQEIADCLVKAREVAKTYIDRHKAQKLKPSQEDVSKHAAEALEKAGVVGVNGNPISAPYIKRNALQGEWWKANKP